MSKDNQLSIYIPLEKQTERLVERLSVLASRRNRAINYLVVEAILEYIDALEPLDSEPRGPKSIAKRGLDAQPKAAGTTTRTAKSGSSASMSADIEEPDGAGVEEAPRKRPASQNGGGSGCLGLAACVFGGALIVVLLLARIATTISIMSLFGSISMAMIYYRT